MSVYSFSLSTVHEEWGMRGEPLQSVEHAICIQLLVAVHTSFTVEPCDLKWTGRRISSIIQLMLYI